MDPTPTPPSPLPSTLVDGLGADWLNADIRDAGEKLKADAQIREEQQENFHLHEEIRALSPQDRDDLFKILAAAQAGDRSQLDALFDVIYDEIPVPMEEFILGRRYMGFTKSSISQKKVEILIQLDEPQVRQVWCAAGSGSGKSLMAGILQSREVYNLLCLRRPDLFYMLSPGSQIAVANASVGRAQSKEVIFGEFQARIKHSPWFQGKYEDPTAERIHFMKDVYAVSTGRSPTSLYGYHTKSGILDEAAFMMNGEVDLAKLIIEAMQKSMHTRFPRAWKLFVISTLRGTDDILYRNIARIKGEGVQLV